jgi:NitT/TauT family transport system permease protein
VKRGRRGGRRASGGVAIAVLFYLLVRVAHGVNAPFNRVSAPSSVSTDPANLPYYAARSLLRMFAALVVSTLFTFVYATAAARLRRAEKILLPILDVLQSVPVLGFLSVTLSVWLTLFPRRTPKSSWTSPSSGAGTASCSTTTPAPASWS